MKINHRDRDADDRFYILDFINKKIKNGHKMIFCRFKEMLRGQKCKEPWIKSHSHVITMISQSATKKKKKDKGCLSTST